MRCLKNPLLLVVGSGASKVCIRWQQLITSEIQICCSGVWVCGLPWSLCAVPIRVFLFSLRHVGLAVPGSCRLHCL